MYPEKHSVNLSKIVTRKSVYPEVKCIWPASGGFKKADHAAFKFLRKLPSRTTGSLWSTAKLYSTDGKMYAWKQFNLVSMSVQFKTIRPKIAQWLIKPISDVLRESTKWMQICFCQSKTNRPLAKPVPGKSNPKKWIRFRLTVKRHRQREIIVKQKIAEPI